MHIKKIIILFIAISCGTTPDVIKKTETLAASTEELKNSCEQRQVALACARYGYLSRDLKYTKEACRLGDQNSCFNVRELEERIPQQNFSIIHSSQGQIYGCYVNHSIDTDQGEGMKQMKEVKLLFSINTSGKMTSLSVQGKTLSEKFKECVVKSFSSRKFIPSDIDQTISYDLILPAIIRDKRLEKAPKILE